MIIPLAKVSFLMSVVGLLWVFIAIALILMVLLQKGRGGGLSAAFGGAGSGSLLGTKTGDFLTWVTIGLVVLFLLLSVVMARFYRPVSSSDLVAPQQQQVPAQTTMPQVQTEEVQEE